MPSTVTVVGSGGVPVVDATPGSGTPANTATTKGTPVVNATGACPVTIVTSGATPVVFVSADGATFKPGGV